MLNRLKAGRARRVVEIMSCLLRTARWIPRGFNDLENLRTLCVSCHLDKTWAERVTPEQRIWRAYSRKIDSKAVL